MEKTAASKVSIAIARPHRHSGPRGRRARTLTGIASGGYRGEFAAWDPVQRKKVWETHENFPVWSGTMVTGGDVAFYGTMDRWFKAVDAKTGQLLWKIRTPSDIIGQPIS